MAIVLIFALFVFLCGLFVFIQNRRYERWLKTGPGRIEITACGSAELEYRLRRMAAAWPFAEIMVTSGSEEILKAAGLMSRRFWGVRANRQNVH